MEKTDSLLKPILKKLGIADGVCLSRIKTEWDNIFTEPLSSHMFPSKLFEGELLLNVDSPIWMHQLGFYKQEILKKLRRYGIRDVRFSLGRIPRKKGSEQPPKNTRCLTPRDITFIDEIISGITDNDLKEAVREAAKKSLQSSGPAR
ncbi:MAG: DUF721 domain-containing protein [Nitrospirae bacterium]|nr:DUF721 domain-containing protein [Nitrospirota bacterium]